MTYIIALALGFLAGALVFRKHRAKLDGAEAKGKELLVALKSK